MIPTDTLMSGRSCSLVCMDMCTCVYVCYSMYVYVCMYIAHLHIDADALYTMHEHNTLAKETHVYLYHNLHTHTHG